MIYSKKEPYTTCPSSIMLIYHRVLCSFDIEYYAHLPSSIMLIRHRVLCSSAIEYYAHLTSSIMLIRHRSIYSFAIAVYLPKPGQRAAGRKCPSQSETMIKTSVFYLQSVLSIQPVTVSVSAPVILSVLRDGEQDDRYRKSGKNRHRQPAGVMPP